MDPASRVKWLQGQIESHKLVKRNCEINGDQVGSKREERSIKKLQREIDRLL